MDKIREKYSQATNRHVTHWFGLAIGLVGGLTIDALFSFRTGTFFHFYRNCSGNEWVAGF